MNDTYVELLIKKPRSKKLAMLYSLLMGLGIAVILLGTMTTIWITLFGVLLAIAAYLIMYNSRIEYEYLYLDKELAVDQIKNQSRRKRVRTYNLTSITVMAPVGSHRLDGYARLKPVDFSSEQPEADPYEMVIEGAAGKERVVLDTNEELLTAMQKAAPRSIFRD